MTAAVETLSSADKPLPRIMGVLRPSENTLAAISANNRLSGHAADAGSQNGEDGIILKIIDTIGLSHPGWCVEFGACDGKLHSNSWNLVKRYGWKAVYIEPNPVFFKQLQEHCAQTPDTWCFNDYVGWEGESRLDSILARTPIPADFEFMSVDIDGPDYYVWEALEQYRPHIVCIEFNRLIGTAVEWVPPHEAMAGRPSSLRALHALAKRKGYAMVCVIGWNAFFVRQEHFVKFGIADDSPESMYFAHEEMRVFQGYDGTLFLCGNDKFYWKAQKNQAGRITNVAISHNDIQVLPEGLRVFRPRHTYRSQTLERQAGQLDARRVPGNVLLQHRRNVTSENGEDGILEHIFDTLGISQGYIVDVGACDGRLWSHSWNLIANRGWGGLMIEKDPEAFARLAQAHLAHPRVQCLHAEAHARGPQSLEALLSAHNVPAALDMLTIDVEGNDYHLLNSLRNYSPAVVAVDFNPSISNDVCFVQEENTQAHYGSSLSAFALLAHSRQYGLAAVTDWNAIFVRGDLFPRLGVSGGIDAMYYPPFEMRMFQTLDSYLHLVGCTTLVRQDYAIDAEDFQVLPRNLRGLERTCARWEGMVSTFYVD